MKVERIRLRRWPPWPWWSIVLPALWLALGGATLILSSRTGRPVQLCLFKHFTGYPCPTCGFTRGTLSFLHGHPIRAWLYNPLLFSFLGVFAAVVAARVLFGRGLAIHLSGNERKVAWATMIVLFVANWFYVIRCVG